LGTFKSCIKRGNKNYFNSTVNIIVNSQLVDVDSEEEMLGFGIGIILLNLGIYVLGSVLGVMKFGNYTKHKLCKYLG